MENECVKTSNEGTSADVETLGNHTHTSVFPNMKTDNKKTNFKKVIIQYSTFPRSYNGGEIRLDTFDNGTIIIELPRDSDISINLKP